MQCSGAPITRGALAAAMQHRCARAVWRRLSSAAGDMTPADAFLASFVNWEAAGVPASAGVAAAVPPPAAAVAGGATSSSSGSSSTSVFDLGRMRALLARLGDPQSMLRVVHVAGTKGKGSVSVMLASMLRAAGYRVGCYTSPHLFHLTERIHCPTASATAAAVGGGCAGVPIARDTFEALVLAARSAIEQAQRDLGGAATGEVTAASAGSSCASGGGNLSHFEVTTALALLHFVREGADIAVVEAGLGGATDATNVAPPERLQAAVVTPIGMDHLAALGGSLQSIAAAKAGILRAGRPVVLAAQPHREAGQVVEAEALRLGCPLVRAEEWVQVTSHPIQLRPGPAVQCARQPVDIRIREGAQAQEGLSAALAGIPMQLVGSHQAANAAAAVAAVAQLRLQGWDVPDAAIARGLAEAFLAGRFQVVRMAGDGPCYVLDGAHTADSAAALAGTLRAVFPTAPVALVVAMAGDKEHRATLAALRGMTPSAVVFTSVPIAGSHQRSAPPGTLAAHWEAAAILSTGRPFRCRQLIQASLTAAMEKARAELRAQPRAHGVVCVTGSLHTVAAAMKQLGLAPARLPQP